MIYFKNVFITYTSQVKQPQTFKKIWNIRGVYSSTFKMVVELAV